MGASYLSEDGKKRDCGAGGGWQTTCMLVLMMGMMIDGGGGGDQEDKSKLGNSHSSLVRTFFAPFFLVYSTPWFCQCCGTDQTSCQAAVE